MTSFVIAHGPDMANHKIARNQDEEESSSLHVIDLFCIICKLLDKQIPEFAQGNTKRASLLLRYPSDPEVVKVIRSWFHTWMLPQNVPITSKFQLSTRVFTLYFSVVMPSNLFLVDCIIFTSIK